MASLYFQKSKNAYIVEFNDHNYTYSIKKYGIYAKSMAEYTKKHDVRINNWFEEKEDNSIILYLYYKPEDKYYEAIIDKDDYEKIKDFYWSVEQHHREYYVRSEKIINGTKKKFKLHRVIMNVTDPNTGIDHINGNGLDNRKINLRIASTSLNNLNKLKTQLNNTSGVRGVHLHKNSWVAEWVDYETKKSRQKSFSIEKYGDEQAKEMAIKIRKEMEIKNKYFE